MILLKEKSGKTLTGFVFLALLGHVVAHETFAVIVSSSRFWLNYRHAANAFSIYETVRRFGVPDSNIILMIADCSTCDARNPLPGHLAIDVGLDAPSKHPYEAEIDYRGREVSVNTLLRVLTGRHPPGTPSHRQLRSHANSSVLLYLTGHGGDGFLKFHDQEELLSSHLAKAVEDMYENKRYGELLVLLDTCQAATMYSEIQVPGWLGISSSMLGQSSYALHNDPYVGAHLVDELTYHMVRYLENISWESICGHQRRVAGEASPLPLADLVDHIRKEKPMSSEIHTDASKLGRPYHDVLVGDFFAECRPWKHEFVNHDFEDAARSLAGILVQ